MSELCSKVVMGHSRLLSREMSEIFWEAVSAASGKEDLRGLQRSRGEVIKI